MPDAPSHLGDYAQGSVTIQYAYFAKVLKPGMNADQIAKSMKGFISPFTNLSDTDIAYFAQRYKILSSSSETRFAFSSGLDALVLKDSLTGMIIPVSAGIGPDPATASGEFGETALRTAFKGANLPQFDDFYRMVTEARSADPNSLVAMFGHSQGVANTTLVYAAAIRDGWENKIAGVYNYAGYGIDVPALVVGSKEGSDLAYSIERFTGDIRIVNFYHTGDPIAKAGRLLGNKLYGLTYPIDDTPLGLSLGDILQGRSSHAAGYFRRTLGEIYKDVAIPTLPGRDDQNFPADARNNAEIVVTGSRTKVVVHGGRLPPVRQRDPATGVLLPGNLHLAAGGGIADQFGRTTEYEIGTVNGQKVVTRSVSYDALDAKGNSRIAVVKTYSGNRVTSSDIRIANNPIGIEFSQVGAILGQQLGYRLANGNALTGIVYSAALQTLGDNLGDVLDGLVGRESVKHTIDDAFAATGNEFLSNLKSAGIGALSSFITAQLVSALGLNGFAGGLANSAAGTYMSAIITALPQIMANPAKIVDVLKGVNVGNVIGGFLGSTLAAQIVTFDTIGGQLGAAVGSALAAGVMTAALAAATPTGLAATFANIAVVGGPLGVAVAAFVGFLVGGLIGSLFGGTPRSGADATWDANQNKFVVSNVWARKGGSQEAARGLASAAAETFNAVLSAVGGTLLNPAAVTSGSYGMRKSEFVYQSQSSQDQNYITFRVSSKDKDAYSRIVGYGVVQGMTDPDFQIAGGDIYVKRAIYNTFALGLDATRFDTSVLLGNISSAQSYEKYLENAAVINALVSAEPDSVMAAETLLNLARADELGLTRRAASDWFGGFTFLLKEAGATAAGTNFTFDYDPASGQVSRLIGIGAYSLTDTIDIAGQTTIQATAAAETIDLRTARLADQRGYTVNGKLNNDIAVAGADFTAVSQTVTFAATELRKSVAVTLTKDGVAEATETFLGTLSGGTDLSIVGGSAEATVLDGTAALPTLLVGRSFAREGDLYAVFRVSLSKAAAGAVSASLAVLDDTTTVGIDRGAGIEVSDDGVTWTAATALTFAAGQVQKFVRVAVLADNVANPDYVAPVTDPFGGASIPGNGQGSGGPQFLNVEGNERFTLAATVTVGAALIANVADVNGAVSARGTGTILDATTGTVPLAWIDAVTVDEASGQAVFSIARSRLAATGSLTFATADRKELAIDVAATVDAGDGNDVVYASNLGDNLFGGAGNDTLYGGRLDDWLLGGDGDDVLDAGGPAAGTLGGDGNYLDGGAGNDVLIGREGSDWLEGGAGADRLEGGNGDDILAGGAGDGDVMRGGRGNDQYLFRLGDGTDTIRDESGLTVDQVVDAAYGDPTSYDAAAASGALFAAGRGLNNWRGGGIATAGAGASGVAAGGEDALVMGAGIALEDVKIGKSADGRDLWIEIWQKGVFTGDRVTLGDWFNAFNRIEMLRFADGNELRLTDLDTFILGTDGSDVLLGTAGNDFLYGGDGEDRIAALAGNDVANGGRGNDFVAGDSGNDLVIGADGDDTLDGGDGRDVVTGGRGNDRVFGADGNDVLSGGAGDDEVIGGAGDDVIKYQRGDGRDTVIDALGGTWTLAWVSGSGAQAGFTLRADGCLMQGTTEVFNGSAWLLRTRYDDEQGKLWVLTNPTDATSAGNDTIEFAIGIDINDVQFQLVNQGRHLALGISPAGGTASRFADLTDQIILKDWATPTGEGAIEKMVFFNTGAVDTSTAGYKLTGATDGNDAVVGAAGRKNWITGGAGDDQLTGAEREDILNGGSGQDMLSGLAGNDVLLGGSDNDILIGGAGADTLVGGSGIDTASYQNAGGAVFASLQQASAAALSGDAAGDSFDSVENLTGSDYDDTLEGDVFGNDLRGGKGNDLLRGGGGDDTYLFGRGDGNDTILDAATSGEVVVIDAKGMLQPPFTASLQLVDRDDASGVWQFEHLVTNTQTGEVVYRWEVTRQVGLQVGGNWASLDGMTPPTTYDPAGWARNPDGTAIYTVLGSKVSRQTLAPGGSDTILFDDYTGAAGAPAGDLSIALTDLAFAFQGNALEITVTTTTSTGTAPGGRILIQNFRNGATGDVNSVVETLQFSDGTSVNLAALRFDSAGQLLASAPDLAGVVDDLLIANPASTQPMQGGAGNDSLIGGSAANVLTGGDGDDLLVGGLGADTLTGGAGIDTVYYAGSDGGVRIDLGLTTAQATVAYSESSGDVLSGIENVTGSQLDDVLIGSAGDNVLKGNRGNDALYGGAVGGTGATKGAGDDVLLGGEGQDWLFGGVGADNLDGGSGNDVLEGGGDADILAGGDGNDILRGDTTVTATMVETTADEGGADLIVNGSFETNLDGTTAAGWATGATLPFLSTGVTGITGTRALHLEGAGGSVTVSQKIANLSPGDSLSLQFNLAGKVTGPGAAVEVLWNGVVIARYEPASTALTNTTLALNDAFLAARGAQFIAGTNTLSFRGAAVAAAATDNAGGVIDNVRLTRNGGGADRLIGGAGSDRLLGGGGNDTLLGGEGDDSSAVAITAGAPARHDDGAGGPDLRRWPLWRKRQRPYRWRGGERLAGWRRRQRHLRAARLRGQ